MTHIKKLVMQGFKSFAPKTEILFDKGINVVVGPNGSGKSNISDALCFALGRLSVKSMRAAKAKNLLFMGSKTHKPSREASAELVLDNINKTFNLPSEEISIKRIVRHNGQSIYKINNETKTRSEVIETLAHAGIDPYGFNIILQGNIQGFVKLHPEERRKIIEEVAGISIYESRKEKSLKELEKTEGRLKEISTVLRERTSFLRNLERERAQALRFKELETTIKRCKASILTKKKEDKEKELAAIKNSISSKTAQKDSIKSQVEELQNKISGYNRKIEQINKHIQQSTGLEQETLHESIAGLKAELEGLKVRKENYENRKHEIQNRIEQIQNSIPEHESEILELRKESPKLAKKQEEIKKKKQELSELEEKRKSAYRFKTELNSLKERLKDKETQHANTNAEANSLVRQIEEYTSALKHTTQKACQKEISDLNKKLEESKQSLQELSESEITNTKNISAAESKIQAAQEVKSQVSELDVCPLCQNKMTKSHVKHVNDDSDDKISKAQEQIKKSQSELKKLTDDKQKLESNIVNYSQSVNGLEKELSTHSLILDKQQYVKKLVEQEKILQEEISILEKKRISLEKETIDVSRIEEQYSSKILEIEEISSRTDKDLDTTLLYKERELEKLREVIKHSKNDLNEIDSEIEEISGSLEHKSTLLEEKEEEEQKLNERFKQMFSDRDALQEKTQQESHNLSTLQRDSHDIEEQINYFRVSHAKLDAEKDALDMELKDYPGMELIKASHAALEERLQKAQISLQTIGSINMRALEVYDEIKEEYDKVKEKADTIESEKTQILKIIEEIDKKKKRAFMKTFKGINELFTRNFSQLSAKGEATLIIQNKEDIFSGGIDISIKMGKGKYFDAHSLSGGEQTLVALALLFAIQEHKPHHFYIFDEIDAALDKRNSERLSGLLRKYIKSGQYIIVTHNDAIITDSNFLYGVSMHEGISKILSLKLD